MGQCPLRSVLSEGWLRVLSEIVCVLLAHRLPPKVGPALPCDEKRTWRLAGPEPECESFSARFLGQRAWLCRPEANFILKETLMSKENVVTTPGQAMQEPILGER